MRIKNKRENFQQVCYGLVLCLCAHYNKFLFFVLPLADRCLSSPIVINATSSFDSSQRLLTVNCKPGHRFSSGLAKETFRCNEDGTWNNVEPCKRKTTIF